MSEHPVPVGCVEALRSKPDAADRAAYARWIVDAGRAALHNINVILEPLASTLRPGASLEGLQAAADAELVRLGIQGDVVASVTEELVMVLAPGMGAQRMTVMCADPRWNEEVRAECERREAAERDPALAEQLLAELGRDEVLDCLNFALARLTANASTR